MRIDKSLIDFTERKSYVFIITEQLNSNNNLDILGERNSPLQQKPHSLSSCLAGFKGVVTKQIHLLRNNLEVPIWKRNYYESIIRDEKSLNTIREYIVNNPLNWENDPDNLRNHQQSEILPLDLIF